MRPSTPGPAFGFPGRPAIWRSLHSSCKILSFLCGGTWGETAFWGCGLTGEGGAAGPRGSLLPSAVELNTRSLFLSEACLLAVAIRIRGIVRVLNYPLHLVRLSRLSLRDIDHECTRFANCICVLLFLVIRNISWGPFLTSTCRTTTKVIKLEKRYRVAIYSVKTFC